VVTSDEVFEVLQNRKASNASKKKKTSQNNGAGNANAQTATQPQTQIQQQLPRQNAQQLTLSISAASIQQNSTTTFLNIYQPQDKPHTK
jgi:hypothetical protein